MPDAVLKLAERGRSLNPQERARLVDLLLATLDDPSASELSEAWDREIERRIAAYKAGQVDAYALEEVLAEARHLAPWRRFACWRTRAENSSQSGVLDDSPLKWRLDTEVAP